MEKRVKQKNVWGLNFPYATRFIDADKEMPNLYNSCTMGIALTYYYELINMDNNLLEKIYEDICSTFKYIKENDKGYFIYYPGQKHPTYNVNALALFLFTRINKVLGTNIVPEQRINEMVELIISEQLTKGSWYYSRTDNGKWIDGFHTGFIIESLIQVYKNGYQSAKLKNSIDKAIKYYNYEMFTTDGYPKYFDKSDKYPIESQNCAQAIQTLSIINGFKK